MPTKAKNEDDAVSTETSSRLPYAHPAGPLQFKPFAASEPIELGLPSHRRSRTVQIERSPWTAKVTDDEHIAELVTWG